MSEDPKPGSFDWLVGGTVVHSVDVPLDTASPGKTLRVEITAKARVSPSYPWSYIILAWGLAVLILLYLIAARPAHAQNYGTDWGREYIGRDGWAGAYHQYGRAPTYVPPMRPTTDHHSDAVLDAVPDDDVRGSDGQMHRCSGMTVDGHHVTRCD